MQPTDPNKFTDKAWEAIVKSQDIVRAYQQQQLDVEHLIIALLEEPTSLAIRIQSGCSSS
jgi:ATP-dependent Clp protease ATP-binding subunit ClpB